jgi:hypothetical protein
MVFVEQPTEDIAPLDCLGSRRLDTRVPASGGVGTAQIKAAMRPMGVVVGGVRTQDTRQVSSADDQHVIQRFPPHPADQPLDVGVGLWSPGSPSRSITRLRACWVIQGALGLALTPIPRIRRLSRCMNTST